jgi:hypothetical protein
MVKKLERKTICRRRKREIPVKEPRKFKIVQTYDIVTPESAKEGDFEECGWEDEEGIEFTNDEEGIEEAANYLEYEGVILYSSWFSSEPTTDYRTGEERTDHYHVHVGNSRGLDAHFEREISDKIARKMDL